MYTFYECFLSSAINNRITAVLDFSCLRKSGSTSHPEFLDILKVIPQFCIAHPFCAYFNNKSLRNIFKMAAIFLQKNRSRRARNGRFSGLRRISKKKNGVKT